MISAFHVLAFSLGPAIQMPLLILVGLVVTILILALMLWSMKRRRDPRLCVVEGDDIAELEPAISGLTHSAIFEGNLFEIVQNGEYLDRLVKDLEGATSTIHFETFLWKEGEAAKRLADVFEKKSAEGVEVRVLVDGSGGKGIAKDLERLKAAGCRLCQYHGIKLSNIGTMNNRDHRKITVIDGKIGYAGGHCITDEWLGTAQDKKHFRDLSIRITGPIVHSLQSAFCENWVEETGEVPSGGKYFPKLEAAGESRAHVVYTTPNGSHSAVELLHYIAIHAAKKSIVLQNPYFLPDPEAIDALCEAVKRGVKIRVMLPAVEASDNALVQHASHHKFGALLKGGVRIFEYRKTLLHQKVFTIDSSWCSIGSANFDDRSFEVNDEISVSIFDEKIAAELEAVFEADLKECRELELESWKKRDWLHKFKDFSAYLMNEQL